MSTGNKCLWGTQPESVACEMSLDYNNDHEKHSSRLFEAHNYQNDITYYLIINND